MKAVAGLVAGGLMLISAHGAAQPWRVVKDGAVHYTSNVDDLPPKMKARILAARAAEAEAEEARRAALPDGGLPDGGLPASAVPTPPPPARSEAPGAGSGRIKGLPARPAGSPMPRSVGERPALPPPPVVAERVDPADERARIQGELAEARAALVRARQQAILIPDGRTYAARTAAEQRVAELEAELSALSR